MNGVFVDLLKIWMLMYAPSSGSQADFVWLINGKLLCEILILLSQCKVVGNIHKNNFYHN